MHDRDDDGFRRVVVDFVAEFDVFRGSSRLMAESGSAKQLWVGLDGARGRANGSRLQYMLLHWMKEEGSLLVSVVGRLIELKTAQNRPDDEEFGLELEGNDLPVVLWRTVWRTCRKQRTG